MVRLISDIAAPGIAAFVSGTVQDLALRGIQNQAGGQMPKWAFIVPGFGAAASLAAIYGGRGRSPLSMGSYCASFSTAGWLASKMFWKRGE